jgi:hypothetical protein
MARYTIHVPESDSSMGLEKPLNGLEAYTKVCELRRLGLRDGHLEKRRYWRGNHRRCVSRSRQSRWIASEALVG